MADNLVEWTLDAIVTHWPEASFPDTVERINRDDSNNIDRGIRSRSFDLQDATYIGASLADRSSAPYDLEYNFEVEAIVTLRIEGLHQDEYGKVASGTAFDQLVRNVRRALYEERTDPNIDGGTIAYHRLGFDERPQSDGRRDYYRTDLDVLFFGWDFVEGNVTT